MVVSAAQRQITSASPDEREKNEVFKTVSKMMEDAAGNVFPESKSSLVHARITKRVVALKMSGVREYMQLLDSPEGASELEELIFALTTNVTRFFREPHHFDDLQTVVLPELVKRAASGGRVRIWSAGCSSGEEPYSIAMTALAHEPGIGKYDFKILATELDRNMVKKGRAGVYSASSLRSIPDEFKFSVKTSADTISIPDAAKKLISFRELNLLHDWPFAGKFDVIFCRNVVIYFSDELSDKLWGRFSSRLDKGGRLFVGHSERIRNSAAFGLKSYGTSSFEKL